MGKPVSVKTAIAMAFPDVCKTPTPGGPIPLPYPNIAQLSDAREVSDQPGKELLIKGKHALLLDSVVDSSSGDEAGSAGGVRSNRIQGPCKLVQASGSVLYAGKGLARVADQTDQNLDAPEGSNANATGFLLSAEPSVLVGD